MRGTTLRAALRTIAIVIALTAAVDPTITARRTPKPDVAVIATDPRTDGALADRVARALADRYTVFRAPLPSAAATVVVGDRIPAASAGLSSPAFAVTPDRAALRLTLENVDAPARAPAEARVPVRVRARVGGARGRTVDVSLRDAGVMTDHVTRTIASNDDVVDATLTYVPASVGAVALRAVATLSGTKDTVAADVVVDVREARWSVLFFDPRPSWQSTFVRRAIERDPRFVVTSRVVTSRNVSVDAGEPPSRLDDRAMLAAHDVIVIGAPEALSVADVVGLDAYLRRRGGSVVLLLDRRAAGPVDRLTAAAAWIVDSIPKATPIRTSDGSALLATELTWPLPAPVNSEPLARLPDSLRGRMSARPIVWKTYVGAGRVIVNGALDSWRFRDRPTPSFDAFWQTLISTVAAEAVPAIDAKVSSPVARPGERVRLFVTARDAALSSLPARATVSASLNSTDTSGRDIRLWPAGAPGELEGSFDAPSSPGSYRVELSAGADRVSVPVVVRADASHPAGPAESDLLAAWAVSRGGRGIAGSNLDSLVAVVSSAVHPASRVQPWSPMREWWWIVPFALALCAEWWLRRKNSLA